MYWTVGIQIPMSSTLQNLIYMIFNLEYTNCRLKSARPTLLSSLSELRDFLKVEKYVSYVNLKQDNFLNVWLEWEHALYM